MINGRIIWLVCTLFFTYEFLLRTVVGSFEGSISESLVLSALSFSFLSSVAYQIVYGFMQIPAGMLIGRFGLRRALVSASLLCAFSTFLFGISWNLGSALSARLLMGLGSSFGFIGTLVAIDSWIPRQRISLFIGLSQLLGTLGPMLAAGPLESLAFHLSLGWRSTLAFLAVGGLFLSFLLFVFVRDQVLQPGERFIILKPGGVPSKPHFMRTLFLSPQVWLIAVFSGCSYFSLEYLSENHGTFLVRAGIPEGWDSYLISAGWVGYALGCPLLGYLSDLFERRKIIMILAALCALLAMVVIAYIPTFSRGLLGAAFFLLGVGASGQSIGFAAMLEQCSKDSVAAGLGLNNAMIALFLSVFSPLTSGLRTPSTVSPLSLSDFQRAFQVPVVLTAISLVISVFFIQETFCKSTKAPIKLRY